MPQLPDRNSVPYNKGWKSTRSYTQISLKQARLKELTGCSNGMGCERRKQKLTEYISGWIGYYHLANVRPSLLETDEWLRHRIRVCYMEILEETPNENIEPDSMWNPYKENLWMRLYSIGLLAWITHSPMTDKR